MYKRQPVDLAKANTLSSGSSRSMPIKAKSALKNIERKMGLYSSGKQTGITTGLQDLNEMCIRDRYIGDNPYSLDKGYTLGHVLSDPNSGSHSGGLYIGFEACLLYTSRCV